MLGVSNIMARTYVLLFSILVNLSAMALAGSGDLDPGFGVDGKVRTGLQSPGFGLAYDIALRPDGGVIVAGQIQTNYDSDVFVAAYLPDGAADPSFGIDGVARIDLNSLYDYAYAVVIAPDGKIYVAGATRAVSPTFGDFFVARLNSDGTLDSSFAGTGFVGVDLGTTDDIAFDVAIQPDGKVILAGTADRQDFAATRLNPDGSKDTSFGNNGIVLTDFGGAASDIAMGVSLQPDGKIVLGGGTFTPGEKFALARYNPDGSLDASFGTGGKVVTAFAVPSYARSVAIQPDGKIVAAGTGNGIAVARYLDDGTLDPTFGTNGILNTDFGPGSEEAYKVLIQPDEKIVVTASIYAPSGEPHAGVVRYMPDGSLDPSFSNDGKAEIIIGPGYMLSPAGALQQDGRILQAGTYNGTLTTVRYLSDGSVDSTFDTDGIVQTQIDMPSLEFVRSLAEQSDGKIIAGAVRSTLSRLSSMIARYLNNGALDEFFGNQGLSFIDFGTSSSSLEDIALQPDGKIVAAGWAIDYTDLTAVYFGLARVNPDGTLDTSFGNGGKVVTDVSPGYFNFATNVVLQPDGKILAAGHAEDASGNNLALVRYNMDGTIDSSFGNNGIVISPAATGVSDLAIQPDGKIVAVGASWEPQTQTQDLVALRFQSDGSVDTSFAGSGRFLFDFQSQAEGASAVTLQADGRILVAGNIYDVPTNFSDLLMLRLTPDGVLDASFGAGGVVIQDLANNDGFRDMKVGADGSILAAGYAENQGDGSDGDFVLARYTTDGTPDPDFGTAGLVYTDFDGRGDSPMSLLLTSDGKAIAGGISYTRDSDIAIARYLLCLLCDDFEDGIFDWNPQKGLWSESGGQLLGVGTPKASLFAPAPWKPSGITGCSDCHVEVDFSTTGGRYGKVILSAWYQDKENHVDVIVDQGKGRWTLKQVVNGAVIAKAKIAQSIDPGTIYAVRLDFDGATFVLTVDGIVVLTVPTSVSPATGTIRMRLKRTSAAFERIEVS